MNRDDGAIRTLAPAEQPAAREVELTEVERKVLETYKPEFRPELLNRWRANRLQLRVTNDGPKLVDVLSRDQQKVRQAIDAFEHKKRRRHEAALSRRRNRQ